MNTNNELKQNSQKNFSWTWFITWTLFGVVPGMFYLAYYVARN